MDNTLINLLKNKHIQEFDFPAYYYKRGKMINRGNLSAMPIYPPDLNDYYAQYELKKSDIKDLIFNKHGYAVLWYLNAIYKDGRSILDSASPLFAYSNKVTRGGINTYKQSGWMAHVLYVFQLITYNIPTGAIPSYFMTETAELKSKFQVMNEIYWNLNGDSRFLLNVLALIHDIGVVDGIQNHDKDGKKYVSAILKDLDITSQTLIDYNIKLKFDYFVELLKVFIENHTLINKVSAEESDRCIQDRVAEISSRFSKYGRKEELNFDDLAGIFLLLGMADLIAVDDSLFTVQKFELAFSSYGFLNTLFSGQDIQRDKERIALMRLHEMLPEDSYSDLMVDSNAILKNMSVDSYKFWKNLYDIYKFEYSTAYLKPLRSLEKVLFILNAIFEVISRRCDLGFCEKCIIRFKASMDSKKFIAAVDNGEFFNCITELYQNNNTYGEIVNMSIAFDDTYLVFIIADK